MLAPLAVLSRAIRRVPAVITPFRSLADRLAIVAWVAAVTVRSVEPLMPSATP